MMKCFIIVFVLRGSFRSLLFLTPLAGSNGFNIIEMNCIRPFRTPRTQS